MRQTMKQKACYYEKDTHYSMLLINPAWNYSSADDRSASIEYASSSDICIYIYNFVRTMAVK